MATRQQHRWFPNRVSTFTRVVHSHRTPISWSSKWRLLSKRVSSSWISRRCDLGVRQDTRTTKRITFEIKIYYLLTFMVKVCRSELCWGRCQYSRPHRHWTYHLQATKSWLLSCATATTSLEKGEFGLYLSWWCWMSSSQTAAIDITGCFAMMRDLDSIAVCVCDELALASNSFHILFTRCLLCVVAIQHPAQMVSIVSQWSCLKCAWLLI